MGGPWSGAYLVWLGAWAVARSAGVAITHDEALTFLIHVPGSWSEVLAHSRFIGSNNHLLSTVLVKVLLGVLPPTELVLTVPGAAGSGAVRDGLLEPAAGLDNRSAGGRSGSMLLTANPFLVDMFTVARGYGLGLGLLAAAAAIGRPGGRNVRSGAGALARLPGAGQGLEAAAAGLSALSVLANLSLVFGVVALGALVAISAARAVADRRRAAAGGAARLCGGWCPGDWRRWRSGLSTAAPSWARVGYYVADWGGTRGFWADSVRSLVDATLYGATWPGLATVGTAGLAVMLAAGAAGRRLVRPASQGPSIRWRSPRRSSG